MTLLRKAGEAPYAALRAELMRRPPVLSRFSHPLGDRSTELNAIA